MSPFSLPCAVLVAMLVLLSSGLASAAEAQGFELKDTPGDHMDVLLDGKVVARYMYAHDTSTPAL